MEVGIVVGAGVGMEVLVYTDSLGSSPVELNLSPLGRRCVSLVSMSAADGRILNMVQVGPRSLGDKRIRQKLRPINERSQHTLYVHAA